MRRTDGPSRPKTSAKKLFRGLDRPFHMRTCAKSRKSPAILSEFSLLSRWLAAPYRSSTWPKERTLPPDLRGATRWGRRRMAAYGGDRPRDSFCSTWNKAGFCGVSRRIDVPRQFHVERQRLARDFVVPQVGSPKRGRQGQEGALDRRLCSTAAPPLPTGCWLARRGR